MLGPRQQQRLAGRKRRAGRRGEHVFPKTKGDGRCRIGMADRLDGDHIGGADEIGHVGRDGRAIDLFGRADLLETTVAHETDPVGQRQRLLLIVRDEDRSDSRLALEIADRFADLHAQLGVEIGQGFVHEEHLRLDHQRPRQGDALTLATRQFGRPPRRQAAQPDALEILADLPPDAPLVPPARPQAIGHIVEDRLVRKEGIVLEYHPDVALMGRDARHIPVSKPDLTGLHRKEPGQSS